jgi:hypothetical protein
MGKSVSFKGMTTENGGGGHSHSKDTTKIDPMLWGRPGHLNEDEADTYVSCCPTETRVARRLWSGPLLCTEWARRLQIQS